MWWLARGEPAVPAGVEWLTDVEAARAAGMRFRKRRTEYLLRRFAGKSAVAAALGMAPDSTLGRTGAASEVAMLRRIAVLNAPTGAPFVQVDGQRIGMDVSLTDRAGWAVCLVGPDLGAVGCDLEIVEPRSAAFVRDFLTPAEQELVALVARAGEGTGEVARDGRDAGHAAANLIWSAKESALKVLRTGLRADTRTVEIAVADPGALSDPGALADPGDHEGPGALTDPGALGGPRALADPGARADPGALADPGDHEGPGATGAPGAPHGPGGWHRLTAHTVIGVLPGWWRRDGRFLLTVVARSAELTDPPRLLPGSEDLASAAPIESWRARPLAD